MRPLLVVPGLFQTEIVDAQQGHIWGRLRNLYGGPPIATLDGLRGRPGGIVRVIPIVPGLYDYDLMLSLERALCGAGYRVDETLHYFAYDWRLRIVDLGRRAGRRGAADRGAHGRPDRHAGAVERGADDPRGLRGRRRAAGRARRDVGRAARRRGRDAGLPRSWVPVRAARAHGVAAAVHGVPGRAAGDPVARAREVRRRGRRRRRESAAEGSKNDLYEIETWRRLRMSVFRRDPDDPVWVDVMTKRLADMRETWRILDGAPAPRRLICICGTGIPTQVAVVVRKGRAYLPGEGPPGRHPARRDRRRRRGPDRRAGVGLDGRGRGDRSHRRHPPPRHRPHAGRLRGDPEGARVARPLSLTLSPLRGARGPESRTARCSRRRGSTGACRRASRRTTGRRA